nr:protein bli-3 [Quercus suber]
MFRTTTRLFIRRNLSTSVRFTMPSDIKQSDIDNKTDPSVARQLDNEASQEEKFTDLYAIADKLKIGLLSTYRQGTGPVTRSMAVSKRSGPDFLFLANAHSNKFDDLKSNPEVNVAFQEPRIAKIWSRGASIWFGDLGDGVHNGTAEDPRMSLIEVKPTYISYYKAEAGALGFLKEAVGATLTGGVANTGKLREMNESEISAARARDADLSS